jgi:hypothetical protein
LVIGYDNKKRRSKNGDLTLDAFPMNS